MFCNYEPEITSFQSKWKKKFSTNELECQTDTYKIVHRGLNVKKFQSKESQTDSYLFVEEDIQADVDETELMVFINKVSSRIINTLNKNERSTAFLSYKNVVGAVNDNICLHSFLHKKEPSSVSNVSQLSWNCTGSVLAASFGDISHTKWCTHTNTGVAIYSLSSRNKTGEEKPETFLETTVCVCCVRFHGTLPSVLAAGTHNGELIIWDRSRPDNDVLVSSSSDNKIHEDSINCVFWLNNSSNKAVYGTYQLITCGSDGTIVSWTLNMRKNTLTPLNCYRLTARDLPKSVRYRGNLSKNLCITSGSLNHFDNEYLVTGTNNGSIFICHVRSNVEDSSTLTDPSNIKSPVDSILASLPGALHAVAWSNKIRTLIAAVAVDGLIHIYNSEKREQILTIDPGQGYLYDLSLSSLMHGVIATSGENGTIVLSDIIAQNISPNDEKHDVELSSDIVSDKIVLKIQDTDRNQAISALNCVVLNEINMNEMAVSDMNGTIYVWQIGQHNLDKGSRSRHIQLEEILSCATNK